MKFSLIVYIAIAPDDSAVRVTLLCPELIAFLLVFDVITKRVGPRVTLKMNKDKGLNVMVLWDNLRRLRNRLNWTVG